MARSNSFITASFGPSSEGQGLAAIGLRVEAIHGGKLRPDTCATRNARLCRHRHSWLEAEASPV